MKGPAERGMAVDGGPDQLAQQVQVLRLRPEEPRLRNASAIPLEAERRLQFAVPCRPGVRAALRERGRVSAAGCWMGRVKASTLLILLESSGLRSALCRTRSRDQPLLDRSSRRPYLAASANCRTSGSEPAIKPPWHVEGNSREVEISPAIHERLGADGVDDGAAERPHPSRRDEELRQQQAELLAAPATGLVPGR